jgi:DNA repair protein RadA/Sms
MVKNTNSFTCQECGSTFKKWAGRCDGCGAWDSIVEEQASGAFSTTSRKKGRKLEFVELSGKGEVAARNTTTIGELDLVLGGGLVAGSAILIGGDPGIGKSTLVLQTLAALSNCGQNVAYITGEESIDQVRLARNRT